MKRRRLEGCGSVHVRDTSQRGARGWIAHHTSVGERTRSFIQCRHRNLCYTTHRSLLEGAGATRPSFIPSRGATLQHELAVSRWKAQKLASGSCQRACIQNVTGKTYMFVAYTCLALTHIQWSDTTPTDCVLKSCQLKCFTTLQKKQSFLACPITCCSTLSSPNSITTLNLHFMMWYTVGVWV